MKSVDKVSVGSDDPLGFMSAPSGGRKKAGAFMAKDIPVEKLSSPFDTDALKTVDMGDRKLNVKKRESVHSQDRQERGLMGNGEMRGLGAGKSTKELFSSSSAASSSSGPSADPLAFLKQVKEESHDGDLFGSNSGGGGDTGGDSSVFSSVEGAHARPTSSSMSSSSSSSSQPRIGTKVGDDEEEGNVGDLMVGQAMRKEEVTEEDRAVFGHSAAKAKAAIAVVKQELGEEGVAEEEAALSAIDQALGEVAVSTPAAPDQFSGAVPSVEGAAAEAAAEAAAAAAAAAAEVDAGDFDMDAYIRDNEEDTGDLF